MLCPEGGGQYEVFVSRLRATVPGLRGGGQYGVFVSRLRDTMPVLREVVNVRSLRPS